MEAVAIVTVVALAQFVFFSIQVGSMRGKHGVSAPAVTGHPEFERMFRIQQNTMEQLVAFIPALWIFALACQSAVGCRTGCRLYRRTLYLLVVVSERSRPAGGRASQ